MSIEVARHAAISQNQSYRESVGGAIDSLYSRLGAQREYYKRLLIENPAEIERLKQLQWEDFACYFLCVECGYLGNGEGDCPSCGEAFWVDLRNSMLTQHLREMDEDVLNHPPTWIRRTVFGFAVFVTFVCVYLPVLFFYAPWKGWGARGMSGPWTLSGWVFGHLMFFFPVCLCAFLPFHRLTRRPLTSWLLRFLPEQPARWRHPIPLPNPRSAIQRKEYGRITAQQNDEQADELLRAPFTGRPCLAYRIALLWQPGEEMRDFQWVLDECMAANFLLDNKPFDGDKAFFATSLQEVTVDQKDLQRKAELALFLRERGFFLGSSEFRFFEEVIEPHEVIWLVTHKKPARTRPRRPIGPSSWPPRPVNKEKEAHASNQGFVLYTDAKLIGKPFPKPIPG